MKKLMVLFPAIVLCQLLVSCDSGWPYKPSHFITPTPPVPKNGFVSKTELAAFAGTSNVRLLYTLEINGVRTLYFVNFNDSLPAPRMLKKPAGRSSWDADSPLLSPDGALVTYYLISGKQYASYVQKLDTVSEPVLIADQTSEPHFYKDNTNKLFVVYADTGGKIDDKLELITTSGTFSQQVDPQTGAKTGTASKIADKAMFGGMSKDGKYLCTGYTYAYLFDVTGQSLIPVNQNKQTCNPSITPDSILTDRMMFLCINGVQNMNSDPFAGIALAQHRVVYIVDKTNTVVNSFDLQAIFGGVKEEWQDPEWSNNPDFFCALASEGGQWDCFLVKLSTKQTLKLNVPSEIRLNETSTPYAHIGGAQ